MSQPRRVLILTAGVVVYVLFIVGWVTYRVFGDNPPEVTGGTASAYAALIGLPPAVFGLYQWARSRRKE